METVEIAMVNFSEEDRDRVIRALELIRSTKRRSDLELAVYTALEKNNIA